MCKLLDLLKPSPNGETKDVVSYAPVWSKIGGLENTGAEDTWYHVASVESVMQWCYACRSECPTYTPNSSTEQGFDCDDFAKCFAAYCRRKKLTNAVWEVWGDTDRGRHAWNLMYCKDGVYEVEPQTGEVWVFGTKPSYIAEILK